MSKILVPVDDSLEARRAVEHAAELAGRLQASVTLMTVVATPMIPAQLLEATQMETLRAHFREAGEKVLQRLRPVVESAGVPVEVRLREGLPADEIIREAGEGYSYVVMGSRGEGLTGREQSLLGSVSDRVLRKSPVPVLLVRGDS